MILILCVIVILIAELSDLQNQHNELRNKYHNLEDENDRMRTDQKDCILDGLDPTIIDKLKFEDTKSAIADAYKFSHTYDGSPGELTSIKV